MPAAFLGLILLGLTSPLGAQSTPDRVTLGLIAGAGLGSHFVPHASLVLSHPTGDYLVRGALGYGASLGSGSWAGSREVEEISVMYGRAKRWTRVLARGAVGVGWATGPRRDPVFPGDAPVAQAVGLVTQADVAWILSPGVGIGVTGLASLNRFRSFGAMTLGLHLGGVR